MGGVGGLLGGVGGVVGGVGWVVFTRITRLTSIVSQPIKFRMRLLTGTVPVNKSVLTPFNRRQPLIEDIA